MSLFTILLIGLVASVSSCMALVGGLVLGISARYAEKHPEMSAKQKFVPHIYFNIGRILGFAALGGVIGAFGSALKPSVSLFSVLTIIVGAVMILLGFKVMNVFPFLNRINITLTVVIAKFFKAHKEKEKYSHIGSILAGVLTFFLPCGFTQSVQLYSISSGSWQIGALAMGLFALGTAPGLLGVGGLSSWFKVQKAKWFFVIAGILVVIFGLVSVVRGINTFRASTLESKSVSSDFVPASNEVQKVIMTQGIGGYSPNEFVIEKGKKVRWVINSTNPYSCASSIIVPAYGIERYLQMGENIIEFTPTNSGIVQFSCSMGMYRGKFIVK